MFVMQKVFAVAVCSVAFPFVTTRDASGETVLMLVDGQTNSLYSIDTTTGAATIVGSLGIEANQVGLAYRPSDDQLILSSSDGSGFGSGIFLVDQTSGAASIQFSTGIDQLTGLAYDSRDGQLFAGSGVSDQLFGIDIASSTATSIGSFGVNVGGLGLAYDSSSDTLLMSDNFSDTLHSVNQATGAASVIGSTGLQAGVAMTFDPNSNSIFAVDHLTDSLYRIDSSSGGATLVGGLGVDVFQVGLAAKNVTAIPEPSVACFLLGLGGLLLRHRVRSKNKEQAVSETKAKLALNQVSVY